MFPSLNFLNEDSLHVILLLRVGASSEARIKVEGQAGSGRRYRDLGIHS